jgi:hypothetical protein
MKLKEVYEQQLHISMNELKYCNIDHKRGLYIAVNSITDSDTGYIIQGNEYDDFMDTVQEIYEKNTHGYNDCILIALEPYNILLYG